MATSSCFSSRRSSRGGSGGPTRSTWPTGSRGRSINGPTPRTRSSCPLRNRRWIRPSNVPPRLPAAPSFTPPIPSRASSTRRPGVRNATVPRVWATARKPNCTTTGTSEKRASTKTRRPAKRPGLPCPYNRFARATCKKGSSAAVAATTTCTGGFARASKARRCPPWNPRATFLPRISGTWCISFASGY